MNLPNSVTEIIQGLEDGTFSSQELTKAYLNRIDNLDPEINSFITVCHERALLDAKNADKSRSNGSASKLTGVPYANKDIFCTKGVRTTSGSKMLDTFISPYDATIVERLGSQGMVMLGKTNMDEFAMGSSNETSFYGQVNNPWNTNCVPGGSSGGSAAAVSAGFTPLATGSDTGGSIRQPAAFCGISGLKPTYGRVSRYGMIAFASSLDQAGPMGRSVEDLAHLLSPMAGYDPKDSTSSMVKTEDYSGNLEDALKGKTIGLPKEYFSTSLDRQVEGVIEEAIKEFEKLGANIVEISLPTTSLSIPAYYVISSAECSSNLSRYDGVRYGHRCELPIDIEDLYKRTRSEGFGEEVKRRLLTGTYVLSSGYYDAYYRKAQQIRRLIKDDFANAFTQVDAVISPTAPTTAFEAGKHLDNPIEMYLGDCFTVASNLAGLPALSIPAGFVSGMPVGLQLIGSYFQESKLLTLGHMFQKSTNWHQHFSRDDSKGAQ
ncbi:MAG: Asp-tRNA(Asn)/Glu-tRNA(Gln) amidotransferase subunit GatA [Gammaproteobacteria bacterium]|jgi:aspartyl-tRNA(Asn)/glutamyl-tRNA(Gln) amidotransferase subunit A|tara:strand:- start:395 stop:1864 length:1470 start_codon:yes stop_codon:yes gene_type:complete